MPCLAARGRCEKPRMLSQLSNFQITHRCELDNRAETGAIIGQGVEIAGTLGSLCDKLATVKLKLWHTEDLDRLDSLKSQEKQLHQEIDELVAAAISGDIPVERLTFAANKVYKKDGNVV